MLKLLACILTITVDKFNASKSIFVFNTSPETLKYKSMKLYLRNEINKRYVIKNNIKTRANT